MWGAILSDPLRVKALVGRYPTNQLIRREPALAQCLLQHLSPPGYAPKRPMRN